MCLYAAQQNGNSDAEGQSSESLPLDGRLEVCMCACEVYVNIVSSLDVSNAVSLIIQVFLSLTDGTCKRRLAISSPLVERAPQQCIALGAGTSAANGTYDLAGWRNGAPLYTNKTTAASITKVWARFQSARTRIAVAI